MSETRQFNELRKWLASEMQDAAQMSGQVNLSDHTRMRLSTRAVAYNRVMQKMDEIEAKFAKAEVESMPSIRDMWVAENGIVREIKEPKPLVIEAGKWYETTNGLIVGPIEPHKKVKGYWSWGELVWRRDGSSTRSRHLDIVAVAPVPVKRWVPWTYESCPIGVVVQRKGEKMKAMIHTVFANGATVHGSVKYFSVLLDEWEQLDGTPCGVEVSE